MKIIIIVCGRILDILGIEDFQARKTGLVLLVVAGLFGVGFVAVRFLQLLATLMAGRL